jgi:CspA family cold shock protein
MGERLTGKVKWFDAAKGYGFIGDVPGHLRDIFVHRNGVAAQAGDDGYRILHKDQRVDFELVPGRKDIEASDVRVIS